MVVIRLSRGGAKKKPFYHINVADKRSPRDGKFIERLGYFNPMAKSEEIKLHIDKEKYQAWLNKGAKPSDRIKSLLSKA